MTAERRQPHPSAGSRPLVVFDLDGTLIDTAADLVTSLNHAIAEIGLEPVAHSDVTHLVGQGARVMIDRALAFRGHPGGSAMIEHLLPVFLAHYTETMPGASQPYPRLVAALDALAADGMGLAVCTNKQEGLARLLLDRLSLADRFAAVTGGDTFSVRKPDGGHIRETVALAGGDLARTVMIGDSINDIAAAKDAGVPSIAVSFGYSDVAIDSLGATRVIDGFEALTPALVRALIRA